MSATAELSSLIAGLKAGDPAAAAAAYERFGPVVRAAVRRQLHPQLRTRFDSLDFVQDVWASFLAAPPDRYSFESIPALVAFLNRVAFNKVMDVMRRRYGSENDGVAREAPAELAEAVGDRLRVRHPTPSQWAIAGEEWDRLLGEFPPSYRIILQRLREGYTYDDIARMAGVSVSTINRIVRRLKDLTRT